MNCMSGLGNALRKSVIPFLGVCNSILSQQSRNTHILKRRTPPYLHRKGSMPQRLRSRHFIYELVENRDNQKKPEINLILTQYVEKLGDRGDKVRVPSFRAYNRLLLPGLAVYDTPENAQKYGVNDPHRGEKKFTSPYVQQTLSFLKRCLVNIEMNNDNPWTLEAWHVRSALRRCGINVNEDCITMPNHKITGPNHDIENREFYVTVTINNTEKTHVRCRIHHHSNDPHIRKTIPVIENFWEKMAEPIFPEDKAVLDALPIPIAIQKAMKTGIQEDDS